MFLLVVPMASAGDFQKPAEQGLFLLVKAWSIARLLIGPTHHFSPNHQAPCQGLESQATKAGIPNFFIILDCYINIFFWYETTLSC